MYSTDTLYRIYYKEYSMNSIQYDDDNNNNNNKTNNKHHNSSYLY